MINKILTEFVLVLICSYSQSVVLNCVEFAYPVEFVVLIFFLLLPLNVSAFRIKITQLEKHG